MGESEAEGGCYSFDDSGRDDFNHIINCKPITEKPTSVSSRIVSASLRHDLSKRGQYYQIYPQSSILELDKIIKNELWKDADSSRSRTEEDEYEKAHDKILKDVIQTISRTWPAKEFEKFCARLCDQMSDIEVNRLGDSGKGWDMLLRIMNPLTGSVLDDDIPAQCKNFSGKVVDKKPIDDLVRCIENSDKNIAYLFILGELTPEFWAYRDEEHEKLKDRKGKDISFEIVDQGRIAELYMSLGLKSA